MPPPTYFRALAGVELPEQGGHIPCPLPDHRERLASCMVYRDPVDGWCYGCPRGGALYDLASLLDGGAWGRELRGDEFRAVKARVWRQLGIEPPARGGGPPESRRQAGARR